MTAAVMVEGQRRDLLGELFNCDVHDFELRCSAERDVARLLRAPHPDTGKPRPLTPTARVLLDELRALANYEHELTTHRAELCRLVCCSDSGLSEALNQLRGAGAIRTRLHNGRGLWVTWQPFAALVRLHLERHRLGPRPTESGEQPATIRQGGGQKVATSSGPGQDTQEQASSEGASTRATHEAPATAARPREDDRLSTNAREGKRQVCKLTVVATDLVQSGDGSGASRDHSGSPNLALGETKTRYNHHPRATGEQDDDEQVDQVQNVPRPKRGDHLREQVHEHSVKIGCPLDDADALDACIAEITGEGIRRPLAYAKANDGDIVRRHHAESQERAAERREQEAERQRKIEAQRAWEAEPAVESDIAAAVESVTEQIGLGPDGERIDPVHCSPEGIEALHGQLLDAMQEADLAGRVITRGDLRREAREKAERVDAWLDAQPATDTDISVTGAWAGWVSDRRGAQALTDLRQRLKQMRRDGASRSAVRAEIHRAAGIGKRKS